jgi:endonuclease/exonuclease/phosphatase family metal-dependent hydrolase
VDGLSNESPIWKQAGTSLNPWTEGKPVPPVVGSTIIAGDFNFQPADPEYAAMLESPGSQALTDAWAAANPGQDRATTCVESDGSQTTLDYAFLTAGLAGSITAARVENNTAASDHFPLLLELEL